jgi:hypothetical protein
MAAAAHGVAAAVITIIITTIITAPGDRARRARAAADRTRHLISKIFCAKARTA